MILFIAKKIIVVPNFLFNLNLVNQIKTREVYPVHIL